MLAEAKELWRFRELLLSMVERELKIRYKNSVLGFLWSFIIPLVTTAVLTFVFGNFGNIGVESFSAYILAAYLPYLFFQQSVLDSAQSVLIQLPLVKKIYFPRELLPLASIIANFIHLLSGFAVFFAYLLVIWVQHPGTFPFQPTTWMIFPLLLMTVMLSTGLGLLVSALNTFYEDVKYLTSVIMYLLFFVSPITYLAEMVAYSGVNQRSGGKLFQLYNANPVAALSTAYRQYLLAPPSVKINGVAQPAVPLDPIYLWWTFFVSVVALLGGYAVFNRMKWKFVERP
jgi:ABC-2 type transport system permease protein